MKILIVDDEELTRTGILSSIDWDSLGIDQVLLADDGLNGLEQARLHRPEIILCDVRMPRMDGIAMLERLEGILPDSVPIFMSGYSDKEYLKAAIRLRAVNYIEKPIDPAEVREAVLEAQKQYMQKLHSRRGQALQSLETASQLALQLTVPYGEANRGITEHLCSELFPDNISGCCFTTVIVRLDSQAELSGTQKEAILHSFEGLLARLHLRCLYIEKRGQSLVYFVFGASQPSQAAWQMICGFLRDTFAACGRYSIAIGEPYAGISHACQSYASAVILLQSSFFFPSGCVLTPFSANPQDTTNAAAANAGNHHAAHLPGPQTSAAHPWNLQSPESDFSGTLQARDEAACTALLDAVYHYYDRSLTVLPNHVKDLYYRLFLMLDDAARQQQLTLPRTDGSGNAEVIERCFHYRELHTILADRTQQFFESIRSSVQEHPTIFLIKEYISKNYRNETLSVKDIGAHVYLSASYVCTFFKNETGQTLNQYLTEYRMERAKQLLADPRYRIADISSRVGYSDGNYFGKSFKKYTGLSPSEYREKLF